ncbi:MAG TPA: PKD domain-containing protein [Solirubrobacteraceae bacterium]|nr:PKD domain-containing protein [Solirubrobacteraceae bacterium]
MRRTCLAIALTFAVSLAVTTGAAQAVVVDMSSVGNPSVAYNPFAQNGYVGVAMDITSPAPSAVGVPAVISSPPCVDPALTPDFTLQSYALCSHGGPVMHANEQFALVWDPPPHQHWAASYVEQFMRDVADGSGTFTSPYPLTTQYTDTTGHAGYTSVYGGAYDDPTAYPTPSMCPVSGPHYFTLQSGMITTTKNDVCVTDAQIQSELQTEIVQNGLTGKLQPGYTPLLVLLMPPGVVTCLDNAGHLCSANSDPSQVPNSNPPVKPAQFCSYHSQLTVGGRVWPYVVQPFTAEPNNPPSDCDEPDVPTIDDTVTPEKLRIDAGARLVSPLARSEWDAITNPYLNGWFGLGGGEMGDNGCLPLPKHVDDVTIGSSDQNPYEIQHGFNNAGAIVNDPFAAECTGNLTLQPVFVVPSAANQGDVIQFDGQKTKTTLLIPASSYAWDFGDGSTAIGPSQAHSYTKGGTYAVTLTVTDRGGNVAKLSQTIQVLDNGGNPVTTPGSGSGGGGGTKTPLTVHMQLMPQSMKAMLSGGLTLVVSSNVAANGIVTLSIPRSAALRAHINAGRSSSVVIGRGTVSRITSGSVSLKLKLARGIAAKLRHLKHLTITVRLALVAATGDRKAYVAAARY